MLKVEKGGDLTHEIEKIGEESESEASDDGPPPSFREKAVGKVKRAWEAGRVEFNRADLKNMVGILLLLLIFLTIVVC